jgi:hypothetical protein
MAPDADIVFCRLAATLEQIDEWDLPTRPTKMSDPSAVQFGSDVSVELDAIEPNQLRAIVRETIEQHMTPGAFKKLLAQEEREREALRGLIGGLGNR